MKVKGDLPPETEDTVVLSDVAQFLKPNKSRVRNITANPLFCCVEGEIPQTLDVLVRDGTALPQPLCYV